MSATRHSFCAVGRAGNRYLLLSILNAYGWILDEAWLFGMPNSPDLSPVERGDAERLYHAIQVAVKQTGGVLHWMPLPSPHAALAGNLAPKEEA